MKIMSLGGTLHESTDNWKALRRLKLFLALSRTPHGILDMATPGLAALLWLGAFPDFSTIALGLMTVFAGYTSVYALNDLVDYRTDKEKIQRGGFQDSDNYIDAAILRHPLAYEQLSFKEALLWTIFWSLLALLGAYLLNPFCIIIFAAGCLLEIIYCLMWKISPLRIIFSGAVKTCGPVAAIFAVDPDPSPGPLAIVFLWFLFWEMGGQNIPNDWAEIEEDKLFKARTVLVRCGPSFAARLAFGCLCIATFISLHTFQGSGIVPALAALFAGFFLLIRPGFSLLIRKSRSRALILFNLASYYPFSLLVIVALKTLISTA